MASSAMEPAGQCVPGPIDVHARHSVSGDHSELNFPPTHDAQPLGGEAEPEPALQRPGGEQELMVLPLLIVTTVHSDCDMSVWSASDEPDVNVPVADEDEDAQMLPAGCRSMTL